MWRTRCVLALIALYVGVVQSWDFATTNGDLIEFYTNGTVTESVRFDSQNLTALIYNEVHNMMLYVNKQSGNDTVCGYDISSMEKKCFTEKSGRNIHGLAFDPVSEKLFFSDTRERSINWISLKTGSDKKVNENLSIKIGNGIPTDLAVDSCRGYVYWINTNLAPPTIERAHFDGSEREVVITSVSTSDSNYNFFGLAIDQLMQRIYWIESLTSEFLLIFYADLNGKNKRTLVGVGDTNSNSTYFTPSLLSLSVSKTNIYVLTWCININKCKKAVYKLDKSRLKRVEKQRFWSGDDTVSIAANYKLEDKLPEIQDCEPLRRLIRNKPDGPFCVHGTKVNGQSLCKCTPGYIGELCDVSVCNNYCIQGNCSLNVTGLPECRCNAGYSGNRCELFACSGYCQNNGDCSLNDNSEPVCECKKDYLGDRCEVSDCLNYCIQGNCSINDEGVPECRCNAGYSGNRCEVDTCYGYCLNNGVCSLDEEENPFCQCVDDDTGLRCEGSQNVSFTFTNTPTYAAKRNQTLADLLSNWRKPSAKIVFIVEDESD